MIYSFKEDATAGQKLNTFLWWGIHGPWIYKIRCQNNTFQKTWIPILDISYRFVFDKFSLSMTSDDSLKISHSFSRVQACFMVYSKVWLMLYESWFKVSRLISVNHSPHSVRIFFDASPTFAQDLEQYSVQQRWSMIHIYMQGGLCSFSLNWLI